MPLSNPSYSAIVLGADRTPHDPLLQYAGTTSKALIEIAGRPMILRVIAALQESKEVGSYLLSGPAWSALEETDQLIEMIQSKAVQWMPPHETPSTSAYSALQNIPAEQPVLLTTADHPLLDAEITDYFCRHARDSGLDLAIGLTHYEGIRKAFPHLRKTVFKFKDGHYCGCNLFAFMTQKSRSVADFWRQIETRRKKPIHILKLLGWSSVVKYLIGQLRVSAAMQGISGRLNLRIGFIFLPFPEAAVDVDTIDDYRLVQRIAQNRFASRISEGDRS